MTLDPKSALRDVTGINDSEKALIKAFMQGAIYSWVKNCDKPFAVRDLVGGENFDWNGTPLQVLYNKHISVGKTHEAAVEDAAKDLGWLVKAVLDEDKRTFEVGKAGLVSSYKWVGNEP